MLKICQNNFLFFDSRNKADSNQVIPNITRALQSCNDLLSKDNKLVLITIIFSNFFIKNNDNLD